MSMLPCPYCMASRYPPLTGARGPLAILRHLLCGGTAPERVPDWARARQAEPPAVRLRVERIEPVALPAPSRRALPAPTVIDVPVRVREEVYHVER